MSVLVFYSHLNADYVGFIKRNQIELEVAAQSLGTSQPAKFLHMLKWELNAYGLGAAVQQAFNTDGQGMFSYNHTLSTCTENW